MGAFIHELGWALGVRTVESISIRKRKDSSNVRDGCSQVGKSSIAPMRRPVSIPSRHSSPTPPNSTVVHNACHYADYILPSIPEAGFHSTNNGGSWSSAAISTVRAPVATDNPTNSPESDVICFIDSHFVYKVNPR